MSKYKLRAECRVDVARLRRVLSIDATGWKVAFLTMNGVIAADVEVTFVSALPLEKVRRACENVVDGHVMAQTVALAGEYTGERREES